MSWQKKLDELFPSGMRVTQIEDVLEGLGTEGDTSPSFHVPQLKVIEEQNGQVTVQGFVYEFPKDVIIVFTDLEKVSDTSYVAKAVEGRDYLLSSDLPSAIAKALKEARS
jgi:hypothetical protein